jgi:FixJ family two-component response regulator
VNKAKPTIAVVDDDPRLLESLENLLESAGYEVHLFGSGQTMLDGGLAHLDCLITDIGMPGMNGFDLHSAVKRTRPELPVFMVTGRHEIGDQRAASSDIAGFFRKPFDGQTLLAALERALGRQKEED